MDGANVDDFVGDAQRLADLACDVELTRVTLAIMEGEGMYLETFLQRLVQESMPPE